MKQVAAAIIYNNKNEILICQRQAGGSCSELWEFPGGKLEAGESLEACAVRECKEELNADIKILELYEESTYVYPENEIHFAFYRAMLMNDELHMNVHQRIAWVSPSQIDEYPFCPADIEMIQRIKKKLSNLLNSIKSTI